MNPSDVLQPPLISPLGSMRDNQQWDLKYENSDNQGPCRFHEAIKTNFRNLATRISQNGIIFT
jgi:hypothetical protein